MDKLNIANRFSELWRSSRYDAGKSQEYMAKALGVSKKTIQNWEAGTSSPSQLKGFEWFEVLGLSPLPYYLELLFPDKYNVSAEDDEKITEALISFITYCSPRMKRELYYLLACNHGSSASAVLEMITAHLHTPLRSRLNVAHDIITNYEVAEAVGQIINADNTPPEIDLLKSAYDSAVNSVKCGKGAYT